MFIDLGCITINSEHIVSITEEVNEVVETNRALNNPTKMIFYLHVYMIDRSQNSFKFETEKELMESHYWLVHIMLKAEKIELNDGNGGLGHWCFAD